MSGHTTVSAETPSAHRPVTSKPRGICQYYNTPRGCYAGDRCKFLHGETERLTPYDKSKVCKFYAAGFCRRGEKCWFVHADSSKDGSTTQTEEEDEHLCSICYDKPETFGLLAGCSHVFCITCIKNWRDTQGKSDDIVQAGTTKTCPMCRTSSRFVTPSAFFYPEGHALKTEVIEKYKASMARVKCRYFEKSKPHDRFCPFGKECFYKHENPDGTPYVFEHGATYYMQRGRSGRPRGLGNDTWSIDVDVESMLNTISQVFGTSRDMQRAIFESVAAEFGIENLPPMYRLEEEEEEEEELATPVIPFEDTQETGEETGTDSASSFMPSPDPEPHEHIPEEAEEYVAPPPDEGDAVITGPSTISSRLDPTVAEFVPSFGQSSSSSVPGPSFQLDWLRPLPPGPTAASGSQQEDEHGSRDDAAEFGRTNTSMSIDELLRQIDDTARRLDAPTSPPHSPFDVSTLLVNQPPLGTSAQSASLPAQEPSTSEPVLVQDADPPFMTDGRGRVVWSSTTSSRGREGRRGRAASSSATVLQHSKTSPDVSVPEESCADALRRDSPAQHLVRRLSLPSVGPSSDIEELEGQPAEFVTDGRGRVVFASNNHDH